MSRIWEETKANAMWLGKIGLVGGLVAGAAIGLVTAAPLAASVVSYALAGLVYGAVAGSAIGALKGAMNSEPAVTQTIVMERPAPVERTRVIVQEPEYSRSANPNFRQRMSESGEHSAHQR